MASDLPRASASPGRVVYRPTTAGNRRVRTGARPDVQKTRANGAFAMASFSPAQTQAGRDQEAIAVDVESGLALRLRVSEQYYQTGYAFDALYGGKVARPEFGVILAG